MNKILGINNENHIDTLLSKKVFSDNIFNGKPSDILYKGYINKEISFDYIVYFEPNNIQ